MNVNFKDGAKVLFGGNVSWVTINLLNVVLLSYNSRGLVCAYQFREVFPMLQPDIYIASSVYYTSRQVHGLKHTDAGILLFKLYQKTGTRVLPVVKARGTRKLLFSAQDDEKLVRKHTYICTVRLGEALFLGPNPQILHTKSNLRFPLQCNINEKKQILVTQHMRRLPEPRHFFAAAWQNWHLRSSKKGPKQTLYIQTLSFIFSKYRFGRTRI